MNAIAPAAAPPAASMALRAKTLAGVSGSGLGTGGMITKLQAAEICLGCGCTMVIANGDNSELLYDIIEGKEVGTRFGRG